MAIHEPGQVLKFGVVDEDGGQREGPEAGQRWAVAQPEAGAGRRSPCRRRIRTVCLGRRGPGARCRWSAGDPRRPRTNYPEGLVMSGTDCGDRTLRLPDPAVASSATLPRRPRRVSASRDARPDATRPTDRVRGRPRTRPPACACVERGQGQCRRRRSPGEPRPHPGPVLVGGGRTEHGGEERHPVGGAPGRSDRRPAGVVRHHHHGHPPAGAWPPCTAPRLAADRAGAGRQRHRCRPQHAEPGGVGAGPGHGARRARRHRPSGSASRRSPARGSTTASRRWRTDR